METTPISPGISWAATAISVGTAADDIPCAKSTPIANPSRMLCKPSPIRFK